MPDCGTTRRAAHMTMVTRAGAIELRTESGVVVASMPITWDEDEGRYKAKLGRPGRGTYTLRAKLVMTGWNVVVEGPAIRRH
jgi:hypothetical protein